MYELDDLKRLAELQAMEQPYVCGICDKDIVIEYVDDIYADDSGEYHYDCHQDWADTESKKWAGHYYAEKRPYELCITNDEMLAAYEPGTAKRYALEKELA